MSASASLGFELPLVFDLAGVFLFALTGSLAAVRKGYDVVGLFTLALAAGLGGGLLRDAAFLASGPPAAVREPRYLIAAATAGLMGFLLGARIDRFRPAFELLDALGLGAYAVVGTQKALLQGLSATSAVLLGVVTAVGGGVLRDLLSREEPLIFRPGHFYTVAALAGSGLFAGLLRLGVLAPWAGLAAIALAVSLRVLSLRLDWRTGPVGRS
jgi:uncharacterized membrane protein YeiH